MASYSVVPTPMAARRPPRSSANQQTFRHFQGRPNSHPSSAAATFRAAILESFDGVEGTA